MIKHSENYNIKKFTYNKDDRKFVSEASDLGIKPGDKFPYMFFIENTETNNRVLFTYVSTMRDVEGDLMYVTYVSNSVIGTLTAKIFND
jgi:hypothetical protein